jgi:hypothetical protein
MNYELQGENLPTRGHDTQPFIVIMQVYALHYLGWSFWQN